MNSLSRLHQVRTLLGANSNEAVAFHGTSSEMIGHLVHHGCIYPPVIERGTEQFAPAVIFPTRDFMASVLKAYGLSEDDVSSLDDYDSLASVTEDARHHAFYHRLNVIFGESLGRFVDGGDLVALEEPYPDFDGEMRSVFFGAEAEPLYDWLRAVLSEEEVRTLIKEIYSNRFGVVVGIRERIRSKIEPPTLTDCRHMIDEGFRLKGGEVIDLEDIASLFPIGKKDVDGVLQTLDLPVIAESL